MPRRRPCAPPDTRRTRPGVRRHRAADTGHRRSVEPGPSEPACNVARASAAVPSTTTADARGRRCGRPSGGPPPRGHGHRRTPARMAGAPRPPVTGSRGGVMAGAGKRAAWVGTRPGGSRAPRPAADPAAVAGGLADHRRCPRPRPGSPVPGPPPTAGRSRLEVGGQLGPGVALGHHLGERLRRPSNPDSSVHRPTPAHARGSIERHAVLGERHGRPELVAALGARRATGSAPAPGAGPSRRRSQRRSTSRRSSSRSPTATIHRLEPVAAHRVAPPWAWSPVRPGARGSGDRWGRGGTARRPAPRRSRVSTASTLELLEQGRQGIRQPAVDQAGDGLGHVRRGSARRRSPRSRCAP